jgi:hypothetical protein
MICGPLLASDRTANFGNTHWGSPWWGDELRELMTLDGYGLVIAAILHVGRLIVSRFNLAMPE